MLSDICKRKRYLQSGIELPGFVAVVKRPLREVQYGKIFVQPVRTLPPPPPDMKTEPPLPLFGIGQKSSSIAMMPQADQNPPALDREHLTNDHRLVTGRCTKAIGNVFAVPNSNAWKTI